MGDSQIDSFKSTILASRMVNLDVTLSRLAIAPQNWNGEPVVKRSHRQPIPLLARRVELFAQMGEVNGSARGAFYPDGGAFCSDGGAFCSDGGGQ